MRLCGGCGKGGKAHFYQRDKIHDDTGRVVYIKRRR
jgi:hypothetical protein